MNWDALGSEEGMFLASDEVRADGRPMVPLPRVVDSNEWPLRDTLKQRVLKPELDKKEWVLWETVASFWVIHPEAPFRKYWDMGSMFLILYSCVLVPYRLALDTKPEGFAAHFDSLVDALFMSDILLNFCTARIEQTDKGPVLYAESSKIAVLYLKGWFVPDFLSSFPFDIVISTDEVTPETLRLTKTIRILRMLKIMRMVRIKRLLESLQYQLGLKNGAIDIVKFGLVIAFNAHFQACLWWVKGSDPTLGYTWARNYCLQRPLAEAQWNNTMRCTNLEVNGVDGKLVNASVLTTDDTLGLKKKVNYLTAETRCRDATAWYLQTWLYDGCTPRYLKDGVSIAMWNREATCNYVGGKAEVNPITKHVTYSNSIQDPKDICDDKNKPDYITFGRDCRTKRKSYFDAYGCGELVFKKDPAQTLHYDGSKLLSGKQVAPDVYSHYLSSFYWAIVTMTTIGYGDILPQNQGEISFLLGAIAISAMLFAFAITSICTFIINLNQNNVFKQQRMDELIDYLALEDIDVIADHIMHRRCIEFFTFKSEVSTVQFYSAEDMVADMQVESMLEVCGHRARGLLEDVPMFACCTPLLKQQSANAMHVHAYGPKDEVLVSKNDTRLNLDQDILASVLSGGVNVRSSAPERRATQVYVLGHGQMKIVPQGVEFDDDDNCIKGRRFFGLGALFDQSHPYPSSIVASEYCDVYTLSAQDFRHALDMCGLSSQQFEVDVDDRGDYDETPQKGLTKYDDWTPKTATESEAVAGEALATPVCTPLLGQLIDREEMLAALTQDQGITTRVDELRDMSRRQKACITQIILELRYGETGRNVPNAAGEWDVEQESKFR